MSKGANSNIDSSVSVTLVRKKHNPFILNRNPNSPSLWDLICKTVIPELGTDEDNTVIKMKTKSTKVPTNTSRIFSSLLLDFHKERPWKKKI